MWDAKSFPHYQLFVFSYCTSNIYIHTHHAVNVFVYMCFEAYAFIYFLLYVGKESMLVNIHLLLIPVAPEVIRASRGGYDTAVDWWSLGVSAYEMLRGEVSGHSHIVPSTLCTTSN